MKEKLIKLVLLYGIIKTNFRQPITFKSGIKSPIYCNFRECTSHNDLLRLVKEMFIQKFNGKGIEGVVGVAVGGVPYSTLVGEAMDLPSGFIRPDAKAKNYGMGNVIEGLNVSGKVIALIEDLVSTGGSVLANAKILMDAGAKKVEIFSLFTYRMEKSEEEFRNTGYELHSLIDINDVLPSFEKTLPADDYTSLAAWVENPVAWFSDWKRHFDFGFLTKLRVSAQTNNSLACAGLDPVMDALPDQYKRNGIEGVHAFYQDTFTLMAEKNILPGMFKPNHGFYEKHNNELAGINHGYTTLASVIASIAETFGNTIPITLDNKRGDIGKSSDNYSEAGYKNWGANALTISPYMGTDSVEPFTKFCNPKDGRGAYILCKTSNPGSNDLQMAKMADGRFLYELTADNIIRWASKRPGVGAVVGGNSPEELYKLLKIFAGKDIPVLVPGVGAQGGSAKVVIEVAVKAGFELELLRINSSSGITHPWYKNAQSAIPSAKECVELCVNALGELNEEITLAREQADQAVVVAS